jgi:tRNA G26 N,N-dimethylase Trm1
MIIATEPAGGGYEAAHDIGAPMWGEAFMCKLDSHRNMLLCLRRPWHRLRGGSAATCLNISSMETTKTDELASASQQPPEDAHAADTNSRTNTQARETAAEQAHPEILQEGLARFAGAKGGKVFYNRVQLVNRDLSVLVLQWFVEQRAREAEILRLRMLERLSNASHDANNSGALHGGSSNATVEASQHVHEFNSSGGNQSFFKPVTVLDAMSATGLRALRYALEVQGLGIITANDRDADAVESIRSNIELSDIPPGKIQVTHNDAVGLMLERAGAGELFDVIDLDPFGSPAALLSSSVHALRAGGMLAVTATDLRVLCGNQPEVCFARYGAMSVKAPYAKEMAIRIVLNAIRAAAAPLGALQASHSSRTSCSSCISCSSQGSATALGPSTFLAATAVREAIKQAAA